MIKFEEFMKELEPLNEILNEHKYLLPWYAEIYSEIQMQLLLFGYVDCDKVKSMIMDKIMVPP